MLRMLMSLACALLMGCTPAANTTGAPRILAIGDSFMAWNGITGHSIPQEVSRTLETPVKSRALGGAWMIYNLPLTGAAGFSIPRQFRDTEQWDWVLITGGGNDLWLGCGCGACARKLDKLISADATTGAIPKLAARIRATGAQILYLGYLRSPGRSSPIETCRDEGDALDARLTELAKQDTGIHFLPQSRRVPHGDLSYHAPDRIHPSIKASRAIARDIVDLIHRSQ